MISKFSTELPALARRRVMSNVLNLVAPSFIGVSYLTQAIEMKKSLEGFGAKFNLPGTI